ncbi:hypothetical protein AJ79_03912 [Helicocarpus griseus UAMH5409]|uniref:N-acetyltransferase domain-containing protein n=1 Tax=Helicocarpus griseus UAMH5409 TaxID=1447875 RepID=A0A2B7XVU6_9EURO|nr:hypothetical protein AJ79_03912 [Helicocarpus griseus UAMH5409]
METQHVLVSAKAAPCEKFIPEPSTATIDAAGNSRERSLFKKQLYETFSGNQITDSILNEAAKLFSENYGTWGDHSHNPGKPVKVSGHRLRKQYLPDDPSAGLHARVIADGVLAGSAFACRWKCAGKRICWITQLVVDKAYRERGLAINLLRSLRSDADDVYGIASSHPAACLAAAGAFASSIEKVSLDYAGENAGEIIKASPIPYIREASLCGSLFDSKDTTGLVCGVDTRFFVNHKEPLEALKSARETWDWPLGDLPEGHEYLLVMPARQRRTKSV